MTGKRILTLCGAFFLVMIAATAIAEDLTNLATIEVTGKAKIMAAPNVASIFFTVETNAIKAYDAVRKNAEQTEAVLNSLRKIAGETSKIKTSGFSVSPVYGREDRLRPKGYVVRNNIVLETKELDRLGAFIDEATLAGANRLGSLAFSHDRGVELKRKAAVKALNQALKDAESLAAAAGLSIKKVFKITYGPRETPVLRSYMVKAKAQSIRTPIEIGDISIEASVHVILEIN
ncbi:MAG: SIMPL domain-containing protein [Deltaproteobacteria bacterium]|nr:SIMPL domain-containing protein [Deltaproteobacteria bacterium]